MRTPDDDVIIDPAHVTQVGQQIQQDAQLLQSGGADTVQDFQSIMTNINDVNFPVQLYSTFYQFVNIHVQAFTELLQDRHSIGDALKGAASKAELNEIKTVASFTPLGEIDGPAPFTFPN